MSRLVAAAVAAGIATAALLVLPAQARACTPIPVQRFAVDTTVEGGVPPGGVEAAIAWLDRGKASGNSAGCADLGTLGIELTPPGEGEYGYRFEVVEGTLPARHLVPTTYPVEIFGEDDVLVLTWHDGICYEQEALDFVLRIRAVDRAGNEGPPVDLHVADPGRNHGAGCELPKKDADPADPADEQGDDERDETRDDPSGEGRDDKPHDGDRALVENPEDLRGEGGCSAGGAGGALALLATIPALLRRRGR